MFWFESRTGHLCTLQVTEDKYFRYKMHSLTFQKIPIIRPALTAALWLWCQAASLMIKISSSPGFSLHLTSSFILLRLGSIFAE